MRFSTVAMVAMLACAAMPALAQSSEPPTLQPSVTPPLPPPAPPNAAVPPPSTAVPPPPPTAPEPEVPAAPPGPYTFNRVDGGFLRFDNQTGQIAYCSSHAVGWACEAVPQDRAALEKEIGRLQNEVTSLTGQVASLTAEIAALRAPPPPPPRPPKLVPDNSDAKITLPTREDVARARAYVTHAWHRLVDMLVNLQKDVMRKS
jgi:hypothetical protein